MHLKEMLCRTQKEIWIMRKYVISFCRRGAMFACGGPVITAIVWACLKKAGAITTLDVNEVVIGVISMTIMAFIAAGVSIVYDIESLPKPFAALIQMSVLYIDYLGFYLLNGWIPAKAIPVFTLIFLAVFAVIWFIIFISVKTKVDKMNSMMNKK